MSLQSDTNNDIFIIPSQSLMQFSGSEASPIVLYVEPSGSVNFIGTTGSILKIIDNLSGSLFSVNNISGLSILEVFSNNQIKMGNPANYALVVSGSNVIITGSLVDKSSGTKFLVVDTTTGVVYTTGSGGGGGGSPTSPGGNPTQIQYNSGSAFGGVPDLVYSSSFGLRATGSFTGSFTGSLSGTSSWAQSASQAISASYVNISSSNIATLEVSYATPGVIALLAKTGSGGTTPQGSITQLQYNAGGGNFGGVASSSFDNGTGQLTLEKLIATGSLLGTASFATTASYVNLVAGPRIQAVNYNGSIITITGSIGGSDTHIQFNSASAFVGTSSFAFIYTSQSLQQGNTVIASGQYSHAEGSSSIASSLGSHAEGLETNATNQYSHAEGTGTHATGVGSHAEGQFTSASGQNSHAEGGGSRALGQFDHAEGILTFASGGAVQGGAHAEGWFTSASGKSSHAEGWETQALGQGSHAEGFQTIAINQYSHAEGEITKAAGLGSHAEGFNTSASGQYSHAEGNFNLAIGNYSHAEGLSNQAWGNGSHAEGNGTRAFANFSHAEGNNTVASGSYQHVQGSYNISSSAESAFIIGNGTSNSTRSNLVFASASQFQITGSLGVTGSTTLTGSFNVYNNGLSDKWFTPKIIQDRLSVVGATDPYMSLSLIQGLGISGSVIELQSLSKGTTINPYFEGGVNIGAYPHSSIANPTTPQSGRPIKFLNSILGISSTGSFEWHYNTILRITGSTLIAKLDVPSGNFMTSGSINIASDSTYATTSAHDALYFGNPGQPGSWRIALSGSSLVVDKWVTIPTTGYSRSATFT